MVRIASSLVVAALVAAPALAAPSYSEETQFTSREFDDVDELATRGLFGGLRRLGHRNRKTLDERDLQELEARMAFGPAGRVAREFDDVDELAARGLFSGLRRLGHRNRKTLDERDLQELEARTPLGPAARVAAVSAGRAGVAVAASVMGGYGQKAATNYLSTAAKAQEGAAQQQSSNRQGQSSSDHSTHRTGNRRRALRELEARTPPANGGRSDFIRKPPGTDRHSWGGQDRQIIPEKKDTTPPPGVPGPKKRKGPNDPARKRDLEELEARVLASTAGRAAVGTAVKVASTWGQSRAKEHLNTSPQVPAGLSEAARQASRPHSQAAVNAAINPLGRSSRSRRDLDFEERDYEDFEDVLERAFNDLEEREFDDLVEREFYALDELD